MTGVKHKRKGSDGAILCGDYRTTGNVDGYLQNSRYFWKEVNCSKCIRRVRK